jgi:hypothetical protein
MQSWFSRLHFRLAHCIVIDTLIHISLDLKGSTDLYNRGGGVWSDMYINTFPGHGT